MCAYTQLLIVRTLGQLLIGAERRRRMPDSRHAQHMQTHFQLSICSNACSQTVSPQCVQTHAETCPALKTRKCKRIHNQLLIRADTCTHTYTPFLMQENEKRHTLSPQDAQIQTHARLKHVLLSKCSNASGYTIGS